MVACVNNTLKDFFSFDSFLFQEAEPICAVPGNTKGRSITTVDLLFDWFGISCMATDNFFFFVKQTNPNQSNGRSMSQ
jgi:hypothetical protein